MNKKILALCLVFVFLLASCGGGSAASSTINVEFTEFHYTPDTFTIPAGQEITLNGTNNGAVVHEFIIMKLGTSVGDDFGPEDAPNIYWQVSVDPGQKKTVTFTAPADAGEYQVFCGTKGHYAAGMIGKLIVVASK
jgi:plastocyanin